MHKALFWPARTSSKFYLGFLCVAAFPIFFTTHTVFAQSNTSTMAFDYAGKNGQWAFKTAIKIEAFQNPEEAVKLDAVMTAYRRAYSADKAREFVEKQILDYRDTLRKSVPGYKPSDDSKYGRALGTGLMSDALSGAEKWGTALLTIENPKIAVALNLLSGSETAKNLKDVAVNDVYDWGYNSFDKLFWGTKANAVRDNLKLLQVGEATIEQNAVEAHIAYWINPQFREVWDSVNPGKSNDSRDGACRGVSFPKNGGTAEARRR
jgi:hypothetical protein